MRNFRILREGLFVCLLMITSLFYSCSSENDVPESNDSRLPVAIANDFKERYNDYSIDKVYNGTDFDGHTAVEITGIYCKDVEGNACFVAYDDGAWNRTFRVLPDVASLPLAVKEKLMGDYAEAIKNGFDKIQEVTISGIDKPYYFFSYLQDIPFAKNCVHNLIIASDGRVLKLCTYQLNDFEVNRPLPSEISWITQKYSGVKILGYVNDLGDDDYLIMHEGKIKSVYFHTYGSENQWKKTEYALPEGEKIPQKVLDVLHSEYAGFTYTKVTLIETTDGVTYSFVDESKKDSPGHYIKAN